MNRLSIDCPYYATKIYPSVCVKYSVFLLQKKNIHLHKDTYFTICFSIIPTSQKPKSWTETRLGRTATQSTRSTTRQKQRVTPFGYQIPKNRCRGAPRLPLSLFQLRLMVLFRLSGPVGWPRGWAVSGEREQTEYEGSGEFLGKLRYIFSGVGFVVFCSLGWACFV